MLFPATTGSGASVLVTARSADGACVATVVVAVAVSLSRLDSNVVVTANAVFVRTKPSGSAGSTWTTNVKTSAAPAVSEGMLQVTFPAAPTAGRVQAQPAGDARETNVEPPGRASVMLTFWASDGPVLAALMVSVRSVP